MISLFFPLLACLGASPASADSAEFLHPVRMPSLPRVDGVNEIYLCTSVKIPAGNDSYYVTGFEPQTDMSRAHHMLLFACETPGVESDTGDQVAWTCGHDPMGGKMFPEGPVCKGQQSIIYAWARNAEAFDLPARVGFNVGPSVNTRHFTLQVHYINLDNAGDKSGVDLHMTTEDQPLHAGVILTGHSGSIPPHSTVFLETFCQVPGNGLEMHPFRFRTHTHNLGVVMSGYKVDPSRSKWSLIGKMDPRNAQTFYPVDDDQLVLSSGDWLAVRCTMVSNLEHTTHFGSLNINEMCNYYVMYWIDPTKAGNQANMNNCWGYEGDSWSKQFTNIPEDASTFNGTTYVATSKPSKKHGN